ncbi:MAG: hypothetical protein JO112_04405 [Planctomycetes bacterium]|nr:hypothetical protein [Planctomycetota bacterium]
MANAQDPAVATGSTPTEIGIAPRLQSALEIFGRSDQEGMAVTHYGYLTYLEGIPLQEMFWDPQTRSEATARFTFFGEGTINARHETANIITTAAPGQLRIYRNQGKGGSFQDPKTFARGEAVATFSLRYHCVLNVDLSNANIGTISVGLDLLQQEAVPFLQENHSWQLGRVGWRLHACVTGEGWLTGRDPYRAYFLYGGYFLGAD